MQTIKKQNAKVGVVHGKGALIKNVQHLTSQVEIKKTNPIKDFMMNSSCFLFNRKSKFRRAIFKIVIDPDFDYPLFETSKINFEDLDNPTQEDLLN
jgi:hypothetical protein